MTGERIEHALRSARELLGMQIAWVAEFREGMQVFRRVEGDARSFGFAEGGEIPLDETYCQRLVAGEIPNVVRDTAEEAGVRYLEVTRSAGLGSYIGVPIEVDGSVRGTLCCASHLPNARLSDEDVKFLRGLSRRVAAELEELGFTPSAR
jgi:GAF domain-containing protein